MTYVSLQLQRRVPACLLDKASSCLAVNMWDYRLHLTVVYALDTGQRVCAAPIVYIALLFGFLPPPPGLDSNVLGGEVLFPQHSPASLLSNQSTRGHCPCPYMPVTRSFTPLPHTLTLALSACTTITHTLPSCQACQLRHPCLVLPLLGIQGQEATCGKDVALYHHHTHNQGHASATGMITCLATRPVAKACQRSPCPRSSRTLPGRTGTEAGSHRLQQHYPSLRVTQALKSTHSFPPHPSLPPHTRHRQARHRVAASWGFPWIRPGRAARGRERQLRRRTQGDGQRPPHQTSRRSWRLPGSRSL